MSSNPPPYYLPFLRQHLEGVGDFRARYQRLLRTRHASWAQLAKWETRHQLHLDALRYSRESSLELARPLLDSEWEEEVFGGAAVLLGCDEIEPVLDALSGERATPFRNALLDALFWHSGSELAPQIWRRFESSSESQVQVRAELLLLLGRRREHATAILQRAIQDEQPAVRAACLLAGAWLAPSLVVPLLDNALATPALEQAALLALLEINPPRCLPRLRGCVRAGRHIETLLPALAALGEPEDFKLIQAQLEGPHASFALLALGFHGDPRALPVVVAGLEQSASRSVLSAALEAYACLSGWSPAQGLFPEPEEDVADDGEALDPDAEADRVERDAHREDLRAQALRHWRAQPPRQLAGQRIRHGAPWSLARSLRDLEIQGGTLRAWTFREVALHSGHPPIADPESLQGQQRKALQHWARKLGQR
ncbi:hypothetical protein [Corallococcus sp. CA047B]|uniref:hypothetical protein n=1 Tax=Corallococcus sp. CA047B TaxID=2316729 RepID=UPI0011C432D3|nr:hypothetical protein [Corallococcus sp. CA047B]